MTKERIEAIEKLEAKAMGLAVVGPGNPGGEEGDVMRKYKRGGTASMIVSSVCNEHKNSDMFASDGRMMRAFNDHFEELRDEFEDIRKAALKLAEYALAARCSNTPEYMQGLAIKVNAVAKALGEPERAQFDGRDGFRLCAGRQERHRNLPKGGA